MTENKTERHALMPLPVRAFGLSLWKIAAVKYNYHVSADSQFCSVPFESIKRKDNVRLTKNVVKVFFDGIHILAVLTKPGT